LSLIQLFVTMFLLHHSILTRRDTFLQAAANLSGIHNLLGSFLWLPATPCS
jgi:hypothetical protein